MYLSAHVPLAIILGAQTGNPVAAFLIGIGSHFLLDAVPHDTHSDLSGAVWNNPRRKKWFRVEAGVDAAIWIAMVALFYAFLPIDRPDIFFASIAGGILPDGVTGLTIFAPKLWLNKITAPLVKANSWFHWPLGRYVDPPRLFTFFVQLFTCLFLVIGVIVLFAPNS